MIDGEEDLRLTEDQRAGGVELDVVPLESRPEKQRRVLLTLRTLQRTGDLGMLSSALTLVGGILLCVGGFVCIEMVIT